MAKKNKRQTDSADFFTSLPGRPAWYYFGLYALATIILFAEPLFSPSKLIYGTDLLNGNIFFRDFCIDYFSTHLSWPVWDPYIHGGMPYVDGMHGDIFYPVTLFFYWLFGVFYAWGFTMALHVFFAGVFMYLFLKEQGVRGSLAFLFGLIYLMMPLFISQAYGGHNGKMFVIAYTPLVFYLFDKARHTGRLLWYLLLSVSFFAVMVSPHMQLAYFLFSALAVYFIVRVVAHWRGQKKAPRRMITLFVASAAIGAALSAVQFLSPFIYLQENSMRTTRTEGAGGYEYSTSWSLHWEEAAAHFTPEFVGDNVRDQRPTYWGRNPFKLNSEHFSIIAIFCAIFGVGLSRKTGKWFFFVTAVVSLLFALGANTPVFRLFYLIPGISSFRAPSLISFLTAFAVITLGAHGLESFFGHDRKNRAYITTWKVFTWIAVGYTVIAGFVVVGQMSFFNAWFTLFGSPPNAAQKMQSLQGALGTITLGVLISLVAVWGLWVMLKLYQDRKVGSTIVVAILAVFSFLYMWSFDARYIITIDPTNYYARSPVVNFIHEQEQEAPCRVLQLPNSVRDWYLAYHRIEELSLTMLHGNHLASFEKLAGRRGNSSGLIFQPVQDLLNARYIISSQALPPQIFPEDRVRQVQRFGNLMVYENMTALPRAFPVYRYVVVEQEDRIVQLLSNSGFDYRSTIILDEEPEQAPPAYDDSISYPVRAARVYDRKNGSFKVDVDMIADGFLLLSENYYSAWHAYEGEELLPTLRADLTLRAIPLSEGQHTIECRFENPVYTTAGWISGITGVLVLLAFVGLMVRRRNRRPEDAR